MTRNVEHFLVYLLIFLYFFFRELFNLFAHLLIGLLVLLGFSFLSSLYNLLLILCQMNSWQRFSPFCKLFLYSSNCFSAVPKLFSLRQSHKSILAVISWAVRILFRLLPMPLCSSFPPVLSKFQALMSLVRFELIFVQRERWEPSFSLLHVNIQFPQLHLLKRLSFPQHMFSPPLSKIRWL
jgi:hypothetical protein